MTAVGRVSALKRQPSPLIGALSGSFVALAANTILFLVANLLLAQTIQAPMGGATADDLPYFAVPAASILSISVGGAALWGLSKFTGAALRVWTGAAVVITLLSLAAPLLAPVDGGSKFALAMMHVVAGTSAVWGQRWSANRRSRTSPGT